MQEIMIWLFILFVLTGFILWDPFHFWSGSPQKNRTMGLVFIMGGVLGGISMATHFPLWLWALPAGLAALPYGIPPLKIHQRKLLTAAAVLTTVYLALLGYRIFSHFRGDAVVSPAPQVILPENTTPPAGTVSTDIVDIKIKALEEENTALKQDVAAKNQQIEELKKLVNKL